MLRARTLRMIATWLLPVWAGAILLIGTPDASRHSSGASPGPAFATAAYSLSFLNAEGMDTCNHYTATEWNKPYSALTNLWGAGFYLGGVTADTVGCYEPDSTWISNLAIGYRLMPIWDSYQAPCTSNSYRMSSDGATAQTQGFNAADNAIAAAKAIGLRSGDILYLDIEDYGSSCEGPVKRFIDGWVGELQGQGWTAGLYANACNQPVNDYAGIAYPPSDVWFAAYNGTDTAAGVSTGCLSTSNWAHSRLHQYDENHHVTAGGADMTMDRDCVDGQLDSQAGSLNNQCGWT